MSESSSPVPNGRGPPSPGLAQRASLASGASGDPRAHRAAPALQCKGEGAEAIGWSEFRRTVSNFLEIRATQFNLEPVAPMHWRGGRNPGALRSEPLHPSTGLMRWISEFYIRKHPESAGEIQHFLISRMADVERRSQCLIADAT